MLFSNKNLTRLMLITIIILALAAGFYKSALETEIKNSQILEEKVKILEKQTNKTIEKTTLDF
ncbi:MAG TPA: hypothetical protein PLQ50_02310 [Candidatus Woesebacteria bacterium]|nr:hypothetical protein [Candidatus Woesebacteria bacterium]